MKTHTTLKVGVVWLAILGIALPNSVLGGNPLPPNQALQKSTASNSAPDVILNRDGELRGRLVDAQCQPVANRLVEIHRNSRLVSLVSTDSNGWFVSPKLSDGVYDVVAGGAPQTYRLWHPSTAPPSAATSVVQVAGERLVRGQDTGGFFSSIACRPGLIAIGLAAAIAIPIALDDDDDDDAS